MQKTGKDKAMREFCDTVEVARAMFPKGGGFGARKD